MVFRKVRFDGISLSKLMDLVGAQGKTAKVMALNDYTTEVPVEDFHKFPVIPALKMNGEYMRIRDKGPLLLFIPTIVARSYRTKSIIPARHGRFQRL